MRSMGELVSNHVCLSMRAFLCGVSMCLCMFRLFGVSELPPGQSVSVNGVCVYVL